MASTADNEGANNAEKRHFTRIQFDSPIHIEQAGQQFESEVVDISLKGVLVKDADQILQHDADTRLSIHLADHTDINMLAQWDHSNDGCSGFHWVNLDIESMMHLRRLVELNNGDPELLDRELGQLSHH